MRFKKWTLRAFWAMAAILFASSASGAVIRVERIVSGMEHTYEPGITIPGYVTFPAQSNDAASFSLPTLEVISTEGISHIEFYLLAPAGQLFSFTSDSSSRFVFSLNFHLSEGDSVPFSNQVEASILGADGGVLDSFQGGLMPRLEPSTAFFGLTGIEGSLIFAGILIRTELVAPPASGNFMLGSGSFDFINTQYGDAADPGARLFLVTIPEPGTVVLIGLGSLGLLTRRRRAS